MRFKRDSLLRNNCSATVWRLACLPFSNWEINHIAWVKKLAVKGVNLYANDTSNTHMYTAQKAITMTAQNSCSEREQHQQLQFGRARQRGREPKRAHECQNNNEHKYPRRTSKQHNKLRLRYAQVTHDRQRLRQCRADEGGSNSTSGGAQWDRTAIWRR